MRWLSTRRSLLAMITLVPFTHPPLAGARDCGVAEEAVACTTNDECGCGALGGGCAVAASECVAAGDCRRFCQGIDGSLTAVCRSGRCTRVRFSQCAGDCDADAAIGIGELTVGIGIALDLHPVAACANLDGDGDGHVDISELLRAVRATLQGCTATLPRGAGFRGYYDAQLAMMGEVSEALATVYDIDGGLSLAIAAGPNRSIYLSGPLTDGQLTLAGDYAITDVVYLVEGEATVATGDDEEVITGTVRSDIIGLPVPDEFVLRHSAVEQAARFAGIHTLHFDQSPRGNGLPSSATLRLEVAEDGVALSGEGEDRGDDGALYGSLTTGICRIAPAGHVACRMVYLLADSELSNPLGFVGSLTAAGGGSFLSGYDPPFGPEPYVFGSWSVD